MVRRTLLLSGLIAVAACAEPPVPETVRTACDEGHAPSCGTYAFWLETGFFDVPVDSGAAEVLYGKACGLGEGAACHTLGNRYNDSSTEKYDPTYAVELFELGCEAGQLAACHDLAAILESGVMVDADLERAIELYTRSCEEAALGCARLDEIERGGELVLPEVSESGVSQAPQILNRLETVAAMEQEYPAARRNAGERATVMVAFYVDVRGETVEMRIDESSGHEDFDSAALRVAEVFRFRPAYSGFSPRAGWTRYPVTFQLEQCSAYFYHQYCSR